MDKETARTEAHFQYPGFKSDKRRVLDTLNDPRRLIIPYGRGNNVWDFRRNADHALGLWRYTSLDDFRNETPEWKVGADFDQFAKDQGKNLLCHDFHTLPPEHSRVLFSLSEFGENATAIREYDIPTGKYVTHGFNLPRGKGDAWWIDIDTVMVGSSIYGETESGEASTVRIWKRGQPWEDAMTVFTIDAANGAVECGYSHVDKMAYVSDNRNYFDMDLWLFDPSSPNEKRKLDVPVDSKCKWAGDSLAIRLHKPWDINGQVFQTDAVVGTRFSSFLDGEVDLHEVFRSEPRRICADLFFSTGNLILEIWDELRPRFQVVDTSNWTTRSLQGIPKEATTVDVRPLHAEASEQDGTLNALCRGPITPPHILINHRKNDKPITLQQAPNAFDATRLKTKFCTAEPCTGEKIPYLFCGPGSLDKPVPLRITCYAGFGEVSLANYNRADGILWLERGNATVLASPRGGYELGEEWHKAGMLAGRRLTDADFAAVARDCVDRGFTLPDTVVVDGASNAGLIMTNMFTDYSDHFSSLVARVPVTDLYRFHKLLEGADWVSEFGDPRGADWEKFLADGSPYHKLEPGCNYPPIIIVTGRHDDNVHPSHGQKFYRKLQEMGYASDRIFLYETGGGHSSGETFERYAHLSTLLYEFMR